MTAKKELLMEIDRMEGLLMFGFSTELDGWDKAAEEYLHKLKELYDKME